MNAGWGAVIAAVNADIARRQLSQKDYADTIGVDPGTLKDFLDGTRTPRGTTTTKYEKALGWAPGTIREVVAGRMSAPEQEETPSASIGEVLGVDVSDLPTAAQEEVEAAARLRAYQVARELRASLVDVTSPSVIVGDQSGE